MVREWIGQIIMKNRLKIYKYGTLLHLHHNLCLQEEHLNICILIFQTYFSLCSFHESISCIFLPHIYSSTCCTNVLFSAAGLLLTVSRLHINILVFVQVVIICKFLILLQKSHCSTELNECIIGRRNFMDTFGWCAGTTGPSTKLNKKRDANLFLNYTSCLFSIIYSSYHPSNSFYLS